jgi:hypothetical protein
MDDDNTRKNKSKGRSKVLNYPGKPEVVSLTTTRGEVLQELGALVLSSLQRTVGEVNRYTKQEEITLTITLPKIRIVPSDE